MEKPNISKSKDTGPFFGVRHTIILHAFMLLAIGIGMRVHLSVSIVAMTDSTTSTNPDIPYYDWNNKSVILSSFFWGYVCLQLLAGVLGKRYGTKIILMIAMGVNSIAFMLIPVMAQALGSYGVMACRIVQGLSQGFFFPSCYTLLGRWSPLEERSVMGSVVIAGAVFGTVITTPLVGFICSTSIGWPPTFYIYGALGFIWIISWFFFGANSPASHKSISVAEKNYIEQSVGMSDTSTNAHQEPIPWKSIMTSLPVLAIVLANTGQSFGYATLLTEMPNYMSKIMKFDIKSNGLLSSVPYLVGFLLGFVFGWFSDFLINNKYVSRGVSRKIFTMISAVIPAISLTTLSFLADDANVLSVLMLVCAVGGNSAMGGGFLVNHMDLSPKYSGILMAFGNSLGTICSILAPLTVQIVVMDETVKAQWRTIFLIASGLFLASAVFYVIFGSGELQKWNGQEDPEDIKKKEADMKIRKISVVV